MATIVRLGTEGLNGVPFNVAETATARANGSLLDEYEDLGRRIQDLLTERDAEMAATALPFNAKIANAVLRREMLAEAANALAWGVLDARRPVQPTRQRRRAQEAPHDPVTE